MLKRFRNRGQPKEEQVDELLSAYLDGMLTTREQATVEAWLQRDPGLRERLEGLRLTVNALASLPEMETPRNFILSPSMVAPPKPAPRPRRRQTWPVFGWAAVAATLLFVLVFASDVFVIAPSVRPQPSDAVAKEQRAGDQVAPSPQPAPEEMSVEDEEVVAAEAAPERVEKAVVAEGEAPAGTPEMQVVVEAEVVVEAVPEAEAPRVQLEAEPASGVGPPQETLETELMAEAAAGTAPAPADAVGGGDELPSEVAEDAATEEARATLVQEKPTPSDAAVAAEPEGDAETGFAQELAVQATPAAIAAAPPEVATPVADAERTTEEVPPWLRLLEVGLGSAVIALVIATLVIRWLEAKGTQKDAD